MFRSEQRSGGRQSIKTWDLLVDVILFGATVYFAWVFGWKTGDLAWGLWISSLVLGYTFILISITGNLFEKPVPLAPKIEARPSRKKPASIQAAGMGAVFGFFMLLAFGINPYTLGFLGIALFCGAVSSIPKWMERRGTPIESRAVLFLIQVVSRLPFSLFILIFFSIHFLGFHIVHSMFLNLFFPVTEAVDLFDIVKDGFQPYGNILLTLLSRYWLFILASGLSRLPEYARSFKRRDISMMMQPYANVVRMHVMIILFGFMQAFRLEGFAVYLVLILYFFPVGSFFLGLRRLFKIRTRSRLP